MNRASCTQLPVLMRRPHSLRSSRGSGPARCVWPKITWDAGTLQARDHLAEPRERAAAERDARTRRVCSGPIPGPVQSRHRRRQAERHRAAAEAPPAGAAVQRPPRRDLEAPAASERAGRRSARPCRSTRTSARAPPRSPRRGPDRPRARRRRGRSARRRAVRGSGPCCGGRRSARGSRTRPRAATPPDRPPGRCAGASERRPRRAAPARRHSTGGLEAERRGIAALEPAAQQRMVVVAGYDDDLADDGGELAQHRLGRGQRLAQRPVPQLERVAEQHEPVELGQPRHQRRSLAVAAQHVLPGRSRRGGDPR